MPPLPGRLSTFLMAFPHCLCRIGETPGSVFNDYSFLSNFENTTGNICSFFQHMPLLLSNWGCFHWHQLSPNMNVPSHHIKPKPTRETWFKNKYAHLQPPGLDFNTLHKILFGGYLQCSLIKRRLSFIGFTSFLTDVNWCWTSYYGAYVHSRNVHLSM